MLDQGTVILVWRIFSINLDVELSRKAVEIARHRLTAYAIDGVFKNS